MNFAIGVRAQQRQGTYNPGEAYGWWESLGVPVTPRSLYYRQLQDRLGAAAVLATTTQGQCQGSIRKELEECAGRYAYQEALIDPQFPKDRSGKIGSNLDLDVVPLQEVSILAYQWFEVTKAGAFVTVGGNAPRLTLSNLQTTDIGRRFFCRLVTADGPYWSRTATIEAPPNLLGHWRLDETKGTVAADAAIANGSQPGTLYGFPASGSQWIAGHDGGALSFDGSGSRVEMATATVAQGFDPRKDVTWSVWVKTPGVTTQASILSFAAPGGKHADGDMILTLGPNGAVRLSAHSVGVASKYSSTARINDGHYHHVALTIEHDTSGSWDTIKIYIDGDLANGYVASDFDVVTGTNVSGFVHVLGLNDNTTKPGRWIPFVGQLDDVRIYHGALDPADIRELAELNVGRSVVIPYGDGCGVALRASLKTTQAWTQMLSLNHAGALPQAPCLLVIGTDFQRINNPVASCPLLTLPLLVVGFSADASGRQQWLLSVPAPLGFDLRLQSIEIQGNTANLSNGIRAFSR